MILVPWAPLIVGGEVAGSSSPFRGEKWRLGPVLRLGAVNLLSSGNGRTYGSAGVTLKRAFRRSGGGSLDGSVGLEGVVDWTTHAYHLGPTMRLEWAKNHGLFIGTDISLPRSTVLFELGAHFRRPSS